MQITQTNCIACDKELTPPIILNAGILCSTCKSQGLFRKKIIITGITRMSGDNICVSGVDPQTWRFVRPVFQTGGLQIDFTLDGKTQIINHLNLVEIEFKEYRPNPVHHTEDWIINEKFAPRFIRHLSNEEIVKVLNKMAISDLNMAIHPQNKSLFIVKADRISKMWDEISYGKFMVRMNFIDKALGTHNNIPVTDLLTLNFVKYQKNKNNDNYADELIKIFNANPYRYIRVGLTREYNGKYWKQVTAIITIPDLFNGHSFSFYKKQIGNQV